MFRKNNNEHKKNHNKSKLVFKKCLITYELFTLFMFLSQSILYLSK